MEADKLITHEEYIKILEEKERLEKYLEQLTKITRAYHYQWERERVNNKRNCNEQKR